ncbi:MAG: TauD/TfdA family dioxygenase [Alphaproteobacteria bacterium]|nr:TauD/TfdA family dioxygenase [Alphaproteobacteria bacterium]
MSDSKSVPEQRQERAIAVVDGPIAWTADSLTPEDGMVTIPDACIAELDTVAALLRDNPLPTIALRPEEFEMPQCQALAAKLRRDLDEGVGFVLLDRLPVDRYGREITTALYWLLCSIVCRPVAQKWDGKMIYDVMDTGKKPGNGVRPDITNVEQNFHTDNSYNLCPPDYVALLCLQTALEGGISRILSLVAAHNEMKRRHPDLLPRLYRPYWFDRQREHAPDDTKVIQHPLFEVIDGRWTARLSRFQVANGQRLAGESLDEEGAAALDCLEAIMDEPDFWKEFVFQPGQIQIIDNRRCAHKRTEFRDHPAPERRRHLVRLWLRQDGRCFYNG